jgi:hypothetical protein
MPKNFSFTIYPVRDRKSLTGQFKCMYKRGLNDRWHIYKQGKKDRFFASWDDAQRFLINKCNGNMALFTLCFTGESRPADIEPSDPEAAIDVLLDRVVEIIRKTAFIEEFQAQATREECLGLAVSKFCSWDSSIFQVMYAALEDANFHTKNETVEKWIEEYK